MQEAIASALIGGLSGAIVASLSSTFDKSKLLFEKKFEALSQLHAIKADLLPHIPEQINSEWDEACEKLVRNFPQTKKILKTFRNTYAAALCEDELNLLDISIQNTVSGLFNPDLNNNYISSEQKGFANDLYDNIDSLEKKLRNRIERQTDILSYLKRALVFLIVETKKVFKKRKRLLKKILQKLKGT